MLRIVCAALGLPEQPLDALGDVEVNCRRDVLIPRRHCGMGPAHERHHGTVGYAEKKQHRGGRVTGIVESRLPYVGVV